MARGKTADPQAVEALSAPRTSRLRPAKKASPITGAGAGRVGTGRTEKIGGWMRPDDARRARAAYYRTRHLTGYRSFTEFLDAALMAEAARIEREHNGGQPYEPLAPGEIGTGRPLEH